MKIEDKNTQIKVSNKQYIALDINLSNVNNIAFIGNLNGFFGNYNITVNKPNIPVELDIFNINIETAKYIPLIADFLNKNKNNVIAVIANKETCEYFQKMFTYIKYNFYKFKNSQVKYKVINNDSEYINFLNSLDNDMKFDYIIQNPPYSGSLHLDFLKKGYELLSDNGKMVIIEPSTWLINVRKNGKAKLYDEIKKMLGNHIYKVVIENMNKQFDTAMYVPFAVTYIDMNNVYDKIDFWCCGEHRVVNNLYNCNMIGSYDMIWSILGKIKAYGEKIGTMKDHIYKEEKTKTNKNTWFIGYCDIIGRSGVSDPRFGDVWFINEHYTNCYYPYINFNEEIKNTPIFSLKSGYTYDNPKYSDKLANQLFGAKHELEAFCV